MGEHLMTLKDAAARTAMSVAWFRRLVARRAIPIVRLGRSVRLREEDVDRLLRDRIRPARTEVPGDQETKPGGETRVRVDARDEADR